MGNSPPASLGAFRKLKRRSSAYPRPSAFIRGSADAFPFFTPA